MTASWTDDNPATQKTSCGPKPSSSPSLSHHSQIHNFDTDLHSNRMNYSFYTSFQSPVQNLKLSSCYSMTFDSSVFPHQYIIIGSLFASPTFFALSGTITWNDQEKVEAEAGSKYYEAFWIPHTAGWGLYSLFIFRRVQTLLAPCIASLWNLPMATFSFHFIHHKWSAHLAWKEQ